MTIDPSALSVEEYRALARRSASAARCAWLLLSITFVAWGALALGCARPSRRSASSPSLVLVAGFEMVFADPRRGRARSAGISRCTTRARDRTAGLGARSRWRLAGAPAPAAASTRSSAASLSSPCSSTSSRVGALERRRGPSHRRHAAELAVFGMLHLILIGRISRRDGLRRSSAQRDLELFIRTRIAATSSLSGSRIQSFGVKNPTGR